MLTGARYLAVAAFTVLLTPVAPRGATAAEHAIIGYMQRYEVREGESLIEIARRFDLGYNEIADANPGIDPFIPKAGSLITVPTAWIPPSPRQTPVIMINLPELRLYYFPKKGAGTIRTFPLGVGDQGKDTPLGKYTVIEKIAKPSWHVPDSVRAEKPWLPRVVPPGPSNPMGSHALRLSQKGILIHGTNKPWGIGRRSSHGCLRLYPEDIVKLYRRVAKGTPVVVINQPLKVAARGNEVLVEVHSFGRREPSMGEAMHLLAGRRLLGRTDFSKLLRAVNERKGFPVNVTLRLTRLPD